jgi:hypothetical protein
VDFDAFDRSPADLALDSDRIALAPDRRRSIRPCSEMASFYDEIEIEDMVFDEARDAYFYPCPCGDKFVITVVRQRRVMILVATGHRRSPRSRSD